MDQSLSGDKDFVISPGQTAERLRMARTNTIHGDSCVVRLETIDAAIINLDYFERSPSRKTWSGVDPDQSIVDRARALIVETLRKAGQGLVSNGQPAFAVAQMGEKVRDKHHVRIDSYLVLDCVIAAIKDERGRPYGVMPIPSKPEDLARIAELEALIEPTPERAPLLGQANDMIEWLCGLPETFGANRPIPLDRETVTSITVMIRTLADLLVAQDRKLFEAVRQLDENAKPFDAGKGRLLLDWIADPMEPKQSEVMFAAEQLIREHQAQGHKIADLERNVDFLAEDRDTIADQAKWVSAQLVGQHQFDHAPQAEITAFYQALESRSPFVPRRQRELEAEIAPLKAQIADLKTVMDGGRVYGEEDRRRAVAALEADRPGVLQPRAEQVVDMVAEALGMRRAG